MKRPKFLYHASPNINLKIIKPMAKTVRDPKEGPVVFATSNKALASMFLVNSDDSWTQKSYFSKSYVSIIADKSRFKKADKGGAIYAFPSKDFKSDPKKGMGKREWVSKEPVKPISKEVYSSGLKAMLANGVQVYFCNRQTFKKIRSSKDHGFSIIKKLLPFETNP